MDQIDAKVLALITLGTTTAVGAIKKFFPVWASGKEEALAAALPVLFVVAAKAMHAFQGTSWVDGLAWALGGGLLSGLAHDKLLNPLMKGRSGA